MKRQPRCFAPRRVCGIVLKAVPSYRFCKVLAPGQQVRHNPRTARSMIEPQSRFEIVFLKDGIDILYDEQPFLCWHRSEWEEDPEVVFSIVNAVKMAVEGNKSLLRIKRFRQWLSKNPRAGHASDTA